LLPDQHLRPSQRLLLLVGLLACGTSMAAWPFLHRAAVLVWLAWAPLFILALRYVSGSWVRVSAQRGLSWCLKTPFGTRLGSVELSAADIAELQVGSSPLSRLMGLSDLRILRRDGQTVPSFRAFEGMPELAEALHAYLEQ
jgi:hypothetical protein